MAVSMLLVSTLCSLFLRAADTNYSSRQLVEQLKGDLPPSDKTIPFFSVETFDDSLPFYLGRTVTLVNFKSELAEGISAEPEKYLDSLDKFVVVWAGLEAGFAVMTPALYDKFSAMGLPMLERARDARRVLVSRR